MDIEQRDHEKLGGSRTLVSKKNVDPGLIKSAHVRCSVELAGVGKGSYRT